MEPPAFSVQPHRTGWLTGLLLSFMLSAGLTLILFELMGVLNFAIHASFYIAWGGPISAYQISISLALDSGWELL